MGRKQAYLTIDDSPGHDFGEKVEFLHRKNVPALFFCVGNKLEAQADVVVAAIQKGYVIGNHSFSHPHFSDLSLEEGKLEISQTDKIIDRLYLLAEVPRPGKYFRFPYFDAGGDLSAEDYEARGAMPEPETLSYPNLRRRVALQEYLLSLGYRQPSFENIDVRFFRNPSLLADVDVKCTFDQLEYYLGKPDAPWGLSSSEAILARIDEDFPFEGRSLKCQNTSDIVLVHDHDETTELFYRILCRYLEVGIEFRRIA
jgi:peptidoglycan/xylan/chitin deacetylase (PgdA/CDA1 family)